MIPIDIPDRTHTFVSNDPEVRPLSVLVTEGHCVSRWMPTTTELELLNQGGSVELWIQGHQPPVALTVSP